MIKKILGLLLMIIMSISVIALANDGVSIGKNLGYSLIGDARKTVDKENAEKTTNIIFDHNNSYYYDKDLSEAQSAGNSRVAYCDLVVKKQVSSTQKEFTECQAIMFSAKNAGSRPKYDLDRELDPMIVDSKKIIEDAAAGNAEGGTFCRVVKNVVEATYEEKSCMSTLAPYSEGGESCNVSKEKVCNNTNLGNYTFDEGGVDINESMKAVSGSTRFASSIVMRPTDMMLTFNPSFSKNSGGIYKATYTFSIKDYESLPRAIFKYARIDDGIKIYVNGVYKYQWGWGSRREWQITPNVDILSSLKEGENTIELELYNHSGKMGAVMLFDIPVASDCEIKTQTTCTARQQNENICKLVNETCLKKNEDGLCTESKKELMCSDNKKWINECTKDELKGCGQIGSECTNYDEDGNCVTYDQQYRCEKTPENVTTKTECEEKLCDGDNCIGKEKEDDGDFGSAIAMLEVQRQTGIYGKQSDGSYNIFKGEGGSCTVKVLAGHSVMSCCKTIETGDKFQNRLQGGNYLENYGNEPNKPITTNKGSQYAYDAVFDTNKTVANIQSAITGGWLSCTAEEQVLGVKRGSNLCFKTGERCSKETFFGSCLEKTRSYCCFKSTLARIINIQGRAQLGKNIGCDGFTLQELEKLDFAAMDLTEFINEIVPTDIDVEQRKKVVEAGANKLNKDKQSKVNYYDQ